MVDRRKQLETLRSVFLVVQDCFADTETAQLADIVLPTAMWGEKTGCMTNAERRCNLVQKVIDPPGEARADLDIFIDFAARMRLTDKDGAPFIGYHDAAGAFEEWKRISKGTIPDYSGMTYAAILERGGIQWPCTEEQPEGTPRLWSDHVFPSDWRIAESYEKDLDTGHEHTLREYKERKDPKSRAVLIATEYEPPADMQDADYPMTAISGRQVYHWHTRTKTNRAPLLHAAAPEGFVAVNERDAERLGIADGDTVRVTSRRGSVTGPAKVGDVVAAGVVFIPFHYGGLAADERSLEPNDLMAKSWDPVSKQPIQKLAAVRLELVERATSPAWWMEEPLTIGAADSAGGGRR
jgi:anaerobic selenocysteine-containing dehydrogenase